MRKRKGLIIGKLRLDGEHRLGRGVLRNVEIHKHRTVLLALGFERGPIGKHCRSIGFGVLL